MRRALLGFLLVIADTSHAVADQAHDLVAAARAQVGVTLAYDPSYQRIAYPMGDVPASAACAATSWCAPSAASASTCRRKCMAT
jgi:uncharacterized protein YijF (DUF1287 family)